MVTSWTWLSRKPACVILMRRASFCSVGNVAATAIAHAGAETADELVNHRCDAAFVCDASFDAFRYQLLRAALA